jgi:hypothetical protein
LQKTIKQPPYRLPGLRAHDFMERINPSQLMVRIVLSENKNDYQNFVIAQIEQEFEHNLSQQIIFQRNVGLLLPPKTRQSK